MSQELRGAAGGHSSPRAIGVGLLAVLSTTAAFGGIAWAGGGYFGNPPIAPAYAAFAGFLGSSLLVALRAIRASRSADAASGGPKPIAPTRPEAAHPASASDDAMTRVDLADLAEAIGQARISRILLPVAAGSGAMEAIALARRLAARGASTVFVDFGATGVGQEMGLIDPPNDVAVIAASPITFAHSIHRDRSSAAHVLSASIAPDKDGGGAGPDAVAIVLEALGEAYTQTVVAFPVNRVRDAGALVDADTAIVVPEASLGAPAIGALLAAMADRGIGDVLVMESEAKAKRLAVA